MTCFHVRWKETSTWTMRWRNWCLRSCVMPVGEVLPFTRTTIQIHHHTFNGGIYNWFRCGWIPSCYETDRECRGTARNRSCPYDFRSLKIKFEKNLLKYFQCYSRNQSASQMFTLDMGLPLETWQLLTWVTQQLWCLQVHFGLLLMYESRNIVFWRIPFVWQVVLVLTSTVVSDCWGQTLTKAMSSQWRSSWPSHSLITSQWELDPKESSLWEPSKEGLSFVSQCCVSIPLFDWVTIFYADGTVMHLFSTVASH